MEAGVPFFSTTRQYLHGFGETLNNDFEGHFYASHSRYDRKDPSSVAISISPEASLMLGKMHLRLQKNLVQLSLFFCV